MIAGRNYSYREFCDYARRFNQVGLLTAIAQAALALPAVGAADPRYRSTPPWALAGLAKASICHGNRYRSGAVRRDAVPVGCFMYNNLRPEELGQADLKTAFGILLRMAYEQFPVQESAYEELARAEAFFGGYSGRKALEVLGGPAVAELLGAPLREAAGVALLLSASAQVNGGFFDPAWMDQPNFADVLAIVPRQDVTSVIDAVFAGDFDDFRRQAAEAPPLRFLDRYAFNPLAARPFVRLGDGRLLAPVPQLITRKLSPAELYYLGLKRWGLPFARDMGELFEDYVGRQLGTLPGVTVHPEVEYAEGQGHRQGRRLDRRIRGLGAAGGGESDPRSRRGPRGAGQGRGVVQAYPRQGLRPDQPHAPSHLRRPAGVLGDTKRSADPRPGRHARLLVHRQLPARPGLAPRTRDPHAGGLNALP